MNNPNKISTESFFSLKLEQRRNNLHIGWGTGFIYKPTTSEQNYLVTNYHILIGRDPKNPSKLCPNYPDSPDEICWNGWDKQMNSRAGSFKINGNFNFIEHQRRKEGVDLIAIPVNFPNDMVIVTQQEIRNDDRISIQVGSEIFIVGYPFGYGLNHTFPIWKRGTIATEPLINESGLPRFLIDAFTHPGMSGSPVFAAEKREMFLIETDLARQLENSEGSALDLLDKLNPIQIKNTAFQAINLKLIGIYGGRVTLPDSADPNLGIVYKIEALEELFQQPIIAHHPFPHN